MKKLSKKRFYFGIFIYCIVMTVLLIFGIIRRNSNFSGESVQSALLNEKYRDGINLIRIKFPDGYEFSFNKKKDASGAPVWMCSAGGLTFTADESTIEKMLDSFCATRNFIKLSDSFSSWSQFGIMEDKAVNVLFFESDAGNDTLRSSLFFGRSTTDYSGVYVRNDRKPDVYRVGDNVSEYLTDNAEFWAELYVIGENTSHFDEKSFLSVSVSKAEGAEIYTKKLYNDGSETFSSFIHTLLSLRGSGIISSKEVEQSSKNLILEITAEKQYGKSISVEVFSTDDSSASVPVDISEPSASSALSNSSDAPSTSVSSAASSTTESAQYTRYFVRSCGTAFESYPDYFVEISGWTYRNLLPSGFM